MLDRSAIRANDVGAKVTESVSVPEWGGDVLIRRLTVLEVERWWEIIADSAKGVYAPAGKRGSVVLMGSVNADGTPLFQAVDAAWLGDGAHPEAVERVCNAIMTLSGLTAKSQAETEKKAETLTSSSSSGLPTAGAVTT